MGRWSALLMVLVAACSPSAEMPDAGSQETEAFDSTRSMVASELQTFSLDQALEFLSQFEEPFASWSAGGELSRYVFLNMSEFWPAIVLSNTGKTRELPAAYLDSLANLAVTTSNDETTVAEYVRSSATDGVVVVHDGRIVFEDYPRMLPTDKHIWFSVSKTFVSTAVAKNLARNALRFDFNCILYNIFRADLLIQRAG